MILWQFGEAVGDESKLKIEGGDIDLLCLWLMQEPKEQMMAAQHRAAPQGRQLSLTES